MGTQISEPGNQGNYKQIEGHGGGPGRLPKTSAGVGDLPFEPSAMQLA